MFTLNPLPTTHSETLRPTDPGTTHGQDGGRLVIRDVGGYSACTKTGFWRWCDVCRDWQKAVPIIGSICCPTCHKSWR